MKKIFFLLTLALPVFAYSQTNYMEQNLSGNSFATYNMKYYIREINDVVYNKKLDMILVAGSASNEAEGINRCVPWFTAFKTNGSIVIDGGQKYNGNSLINQFLNKTDCYDSYIYRLIPLSNNMYGINGGLVSILKPDKWNDFNNITYYDFSHNIGNTHGFYEVKPDKYVAGFYLNSTKSFILQMVTSDMNVNNTSGQKIGSFAFGNQTNTAFNMCTQPDAAGNYCAISTWANPDNGKINVFLQKFKFSSTGISGNPVVSSTRINLPLKKAWQRTLDDGTSYTDSVKTIIADVFLNLFNPNHSHVMINKKGNIQMVFTSDWTSPRKRDFVAYLEVTPDGKFVAADTLCTYKHGSNTALKLKFDGKDSYTVIYQHGGLSEGENFAADIKTFDAATLKFKRGLKLKMEHKITKELYSYNNLAYNDFYSTSIAAGNIVRQELIEGYQYILALHVNGILDEHKSRMLLVKLNWL